MKTLPAKLQEPNWSAMAATEADELVERVVSRLASFHADGNYIVQAVFRNDGDRRKVRTWLCKRQGGAE